MNIVHPAHAWATRLAELDIPMLGRTRAAIDRAWQQPDWVDANTLAEIVLRDPLMTLRVLAHASARRPSRVVTAPETVCAAILMMGLDAFRALVDRTPDLEARAGADRDALTRIRRLCRRARRAGRLALVLAVERQDPEAGLLYEAALIHDVTEMLIWLCAPDVGRALARARERRGGDPAAAQRATLGCTLFEIGARLMQTWQLPTRLVDLSDEEHPGADRSTRTARLAIRFAQHDEYGWSDPAVLDDLNDLAGLLGLSLPATRELLGVR